MYDRMTARARAACAECPMLLTCLYDAVVTTDVSGFVAGTDAAQRTRMRRSLGVQVAEVNLDAYTGVRGTRRSISRDEVVELRETRPNDTLEMLAERLRCSVSTIKRHLREARQADSSAPRPAPASPARTPSRAEVWAAFRSVTAPREDSRRIA